MPKLDVIVNDEALVLLNELESEGVPNHEVVRQGLAALKVFKLARIFGYPHMGFVSDPTKLDVRLSGILGST